MPAGPIRGELLGAEGLARAMPRFGAAPTVIERETRLVRREDPDVGGALLELIRDGRVEILPQAEARPVSGVPGREAWVRSAGENGERVIGGTHFRLPEWSEPRRAQLEARLPEVHVPVSAG